MYDRWWTRSYERCREPVFFLLGRSALLQENLCYNSVDSLPRQLYKPKRQNVGCGYFEGGLNRESLMIAYLIKVELEVANSL